MSYGYGVPPYGAADGNNLTERGPDGLSFLPPPVKEDPGVETGHRDPITAASAASAPSPVRSVPAPTAPFAPAGTVWASTGGNPLASSSGMRVATMATSSAAATAAPAAAAAPSAVPRVRRRNRMITSCLECRRRKLKCDKSNPCSNCIKFRRDCVFLAPALDTASQLKITEIKEKMGSLERVLEQDVARQGLWREVRSGRNQHAGEASGDGFEDDGDFAPIPDDEKELEPSPLAVSDAVYDEDADDDVMDLGVQFGKLRMTDRLGGFFRPKMAEEISFSLNDRRNDRRSPSEKATSPEPPTPTLHKPSNNFMAPGPTYLPPTTNFFFAPSAHGTSIMDFLPARSVADHLLRQYLYAVHPVARVVHRPSFQRRYDTFWNEIRMGIEPTGSLQAVVFAVIFAGVISMAEDQILRLFAVSKKQMVETFQQGTETALSRANLLRTTKIETMQAFVIYLIPLCRDQLSRAHSALVGAAIRLAECMGLHKDGSAYNMGPVETHVRRMVWYQLCFLDIRTCEAHGPRPGIREGEYDTKLPLNVNDEDLESDRPPSKSSDRWTDITFSLIRSECNEMMRVLWYDRPRLEKKKISLTTVLGKVENFRKIVYERYLPMLDDQVPIHHAAKLVLTILCTRMHIMVLHRYHNSVSFKIPDRLRQIIITSGTEQLEAAVRFETLPAVQPWAWIAGALQQYQTAFLLLAEIFTYPMRREADRIWRIIDYVFEVPSSLSRDEKARLILTELRDRLGAYRDARKLRAPVNMIRRLGQSMDAARTSLGGTTMTSPVVASASVEEDDSSTKPDLLLPAPNGELRWSKDGRRGEGQELDRDRAAAAAAAAKEPADPAALGFGRTGTATAEYPVAMAVENPAASEVLGGGDGSISSGGGGGGGGNEAALGSAAAPPETTMAADVMLDIDWDEWNKLFPPDINTGDLDMPLMAAV